MRRPVRDCVTRSGAGVISSRHATGLADELGADADPAARRLSPWPERGVDAVDAAWLGALGDYDPARLNLDPFRAVLQFSSDVRSCLSQ